MNKKRICKYGVILLAITLVTCLLSSTTLAGFNKTSGTNGTARIAKMEIGLGVGEQEVKAGDTLKLFESTVGTQGYKTTDANGNIVAPGGKGSFDLVFVNNGEIDFTLQMSSFEFSATKGEQDLGLPIYFSITDGGTTYNYSALYDLASDKTTFGEGADLVTLDGNLTALIAKANELLTAKGTIHYGTDTAEPSTYTANLNIAWGWHFNESVDASTLDGTEVITLTYSVTATQVKPTIA